MRSLQVFKIWGIPFKIHPYWFLILFVFSLSISNQVNITSDQIYNIRESWLIGFLTSFLLLSSIIIHQIFHTLVSIKQGVRIKNITFYFLGAISQTEKECQSALGNIKIAIVRPIVCFLTSLFLFQIIYLSESKEQILINIFTRVAILNMFLGFFNLIPISSMDGGILLKSIIWYFSGSKNKGRYFLNKFTLYLSIIILLIGVFGLFRINFYFGLLLTFLGVFGINSSKSESQYFKIENILKVNEISDLNLQSLRKIESNTNFVVLNKLFKNANKFSNQYLFITNNGRWDGFISQEIIKSISIKKWSRTIVDDFKKPIKEFPSICSNLPLWKLIEKIEKTNEGTLLIVNPLNIPMGIVDRNIIGRFVFKKLGLNLPSDLISKFKAKNNYPLGIELPRIIELMRHKGDIE